MKFYDIFFGALAYNSAYSCPLRKIMRKTRFKGKFMGEISVLRNWVFWDLEPFPGIKKMKSRGLCQNRHFHTTYSWLYARTPPTTKIGHPFFFFFFFFFFFLFFIFFIF